ncbi:2,3-bisphosphoglycerate-independent phosphoglycerate mutase [Ramicandelaber brevisporus]|nr:2,3-bisphosphoglycerate-independent phosphoglycerate mutase [Ramicandelaber brevisporus]
MTVKQPVCLIVIDGWGIAPEDAPQPQGDAIKHANTPVMDAFATLPKDPVSGHKFAYTTVAAHGNAVGLPAGLMGNSEVGHLNVGAGRVVYQDIVRIDRTLRHGEFGSTPEIAAAFKKAKEQSGGRLHLLGLVSDGGVHSHIAHLFGLLDAARDAGVEHTFIHFFGDGRDTAPKSATGYIRDLYAKLRGEETRFDTPATRKGAGPYGSLATVMGRYYAMDRDKRWERLKIAMEGLTRLKGESVNNSEADVVAAVERRYAANETDEFLKPMIIDEAGQIKNGDTLLFFDFRSDRMRQIVQVMGIAPAPFDYTDDSNAPAPVDPSTLNITTFTRYKSEFPFPIAFGPQSMSNVLAEWLSKKHVKQCHVAETEKYAHVTFFFNGGTEAQFPLEDRRLIPSPKVATYDLKPEMSAIEVGEQTAKEVLSGEYPAVILNFANPDMCGHTGVYDAAVKGVEATDKAIGIVWEACKKAGYVLLVTADHGNAEKMINDEGTGPHTAHTTARVPFVMAGGKTAETAFDFKAGGGTEPAEADIKQSGALCDVAPTMLHIMGLEAPSEMTGSSMLIE